MKSHLINPLGKYREISGRNILNQPFKFRLRMKAVVHMQWMRLNVDE